MPRGKSVYQMMSSPSNQSRRGREAAFGRVYSLIAMVCGSMLAIFGAPNSTSHGTPLPLSTSPYGRERSVGEVTSFTSPLLGSSRPIILPCCTVNQTIPFWSRLIVCGSFAFGSVILYSVVIPVFGSSLPISDV